MSDPGSRCGDTPSDHGAAAQPPPTVNLGHGCCHDCRVRFTAEAAKYLIVCPECEGPMARVQSRQDLLGFRLFDPLDLSDIVIDGLGAEPAEPRPPGSRP